MIGLRLELFITDLEMSLDFYQRVLNFAIKEQEADGYTSLVNGPVMISLNKLEQLPPDHPGYIANEERPGRAVEVVLEVKDVEAMYRHVLAQKWPVPSGLQCQPWGLVDFRVTDPDGFYLRITEPHP